MAWLRSDAVVPVVGDGLLALDGIQVEVRCGPVCSMTTSFPVQLSLDEWQVVQAVKLAELGL